MSEIAPSKSAKDVVFGNLFFKSVRKFSRVDFIHTSIVVE
jgi:hypothetical protein